MSLQLLGMALLATALVAAAGFDLWRFEIPDTLTVLIMVGAIAHGLGSPGFDWPGHALAGGIMLALGLIAFARGWLGGGDVKLMTGCACWAGLSGLIDQMAMIALAGGALGLVLIGRRRGLKAAGLTGDDAPRLLQVGAHLPYAVGIAGGMAWWWWRFMPVPAALPLA